MQQVQCNFCHYPNAAGNPKCANCGGPLPVGVAQPAPQAAGYAAHGSSAYGNQFSYQTQAGFQASPSGATAIIGGVVGIIVGLIELLEFVEVISFPDVFKYAFVAGVLGILGLVVGVGLMTGATMLFMRKKAGSVIVAVASGLVLLVDIASMLGPFITSYSSHILRLPLLLLATLTLTLALVPSTRRWIAFKSGRRGAAAPAYTRPY